MFFTLFIIIVINVVGVIIKRKINKLLFKTKIVDKISLD